MIDLLSKPGEIVLQDPLDTVEPGCYVVGLLTWLESLAPFRDLSSDAVLARCFAVTLLLSTVALGACKVDAVAFASSPRVVLGIVGRRVLIVRLWVLAAADEGASLTRELPSSKCADLFFIAVEPVMQPAGIVTRGFEMGIVRCPWSCTDA